MDSSDGSDADNEGCSLPTPPPFSSAGGGRTGASKPRAAGVVKFYHKYKIGVMCEAKRKGGFPRNTEKGAKGKGKRVDKGTKGKGLGKKKGEVAEWYMAVVRDLRPGLVKVHYFNRSDHFDEWIPTKCRRLAPLGRHLSEFIYLFINCGITFSLCPL
jgi:hypothetical protein